MASQKLVTTRTPGWCDSEFAHPGVISAGDRILVTTHMPRSEAVNSFGVKPFTRTRRCKWCLADDPHLKLTVERLEAKAAEAKREDY